MRTEHTVNGVPGVLIYQAGEGGRSNLQVWQSEFRNAPDLELQVDLPRALRFSYAGANSSLGLSVEVLQQVSSRHIYLPGVFPELASMYDLRGLSYSKLDEMESSITQLFQYIADAYKPEEVVTVPGAWVSKLPSYDEASAWGELEDWPGDCGSTYVVDTGGGPPPDFTVTWEQLTKRVPRPVVADCRHNLERLASKLKQKSLSVETYKQAVADKRRELSEALKLLGFKE